MKRLKISCRKSSVLFEAGRIFLEPEMYINCRTILFEGVQFNSDEIFEFEDKISIVISFLNAKNEELEIGNYDFILLDDMQVDKASGKVIIKGLFSAKFGSEIYDQRLMDVFMRWDAGERVDWKELDEGQKEQFLRARGHLSGLPTKVEAGEYIIDGSVVNDWYEFYLLLSDVIAGERGFFAFGLDSLDDSLIELSMNDSLNFSINFNKTSHLKKVLGEDYFNEVLKSFKLNRIPCGLNKDKRRVIINLNNSDERYVLLDSYIIKGQHNETDQNDKITDGLKKGEYVSILLDHTECVVSGEMVSHFETLMTDGKWLWSADIIHYCEKYNLRLPEPFKKHLLGENNDTPITKKKLSELVDSATWKEVHDSTVVLE